MNRRGPLVGALVLAFSMIVFPAKPAGALAPGLHGFSLTATVDRFPCIIPYCSGTLGGTGTAVVGGLSDTSQPFVATWPNPKAATPLANTTGSLFEMVDSCPTTAAPIPSPTGSGSGSFSLTGGLLVYQGSQQAGATLTGNFSWLRAADNLVVTVSGATVIAPNGTVVAVEGSFVEGAGAGAWIVTSGTASCGAPLTSPTVRIVADYLAAE